MHYEWLVWIYPTRAGQTFQLNYDFDENYFFTMPQLKFKEDVIQWAHSLGHNEPDPSPERVLDLVIEGYLLYKRKQVEEAKVQIRAEQHQARLVAEALEEQALEERRRAARKKKVKTLDEIDWRKGR